MNLFNENFGFGKINFFVASNVWNPLRNIAIQRGLHVWFGTEDSDYSFQIYINISIICINLLFEFTVLKEEK